MLNNKSLYLYAFLEISVLMYDRNFCMELSSSAPRLAFTNCNLSTKEPTYQESNMCDISFMIQLIFILKKLNVPFSLLPSDKQYINKSNWKFV